MVWGKCTGKGGSLEILIHLPIKAWDPLKKGGWAQGMRGEISKVGKIGL